MRCGRGFTLIELLIVVGIIAILAAIAVPNFLEAQTRSKVARVRSDLRTVAMAVEAYAADHNEYPTPRIYCHNHWDSEHNHPLLEERYAEWVYNVTDLSTPVAYLGGTLQADPFIRARGHRHVPNGAASFAPHYILPQPDDQEIPVTITATEIMVPPGEERNPPPIPTFCYARFEHYEATTPYLGTPHDGQSTFEYWRDEEDTAVHRPRFFLTSVGPDGVSGPDHFTGHWWPIKAYADGNDHLLAESDEPGENIFVRWQYDPSNGTDSRGDLIRYQQ